MGPEISVIGNANIGYSVRSSLPSVQNHLQCVPVAALKAKPAVPKKPEKFLIETDVHRKIHVKDMVRRLQERTSFSESFAQKAPAVTKMGVKASKSFPVTGKEKVEVETPASFPKWIPPGSSDPYQTLEDLKAIDEDIEKLRKQIEERDKVISALREAAEAKDKKFDSLMMEYSKLRFNGKLESESPSESSNSANTSSPSSPPLCNGELCWTDNFVNKNYHAPVYAQLLNDHTALLRIHKKLQAKLESKEKKFERLEKETLASQGEDKMTNQENAINLIMAEQIKVLKEREAQLEAEAEELREQRDLMEFRILELEECRKEFLNKEVMSEDKHESEKMVWTEKDIEDVSDSGVMSLPTSEDLTSDSELGDAIRNYSPLGAVTNLNLPSADYSNFELGVFDVKPKKSLKSHECCLQESGIFEDSEQPPESVILPTKQTRGCQTESILDKTLLDFIDSSCDLLFTRNRNCQNPQFTDDLSTEISKLSVIQKRIQQKTNSPSVAPKGPHTVLTCPHTNSVIFYEERLTQLEDKLKIYESSGDTKDLLLSKRLQKEVELACRVKELTERVAILEVTNRRLEEEKCEFEEAENDTRFQCQRLEVRLKELLDKNTELEVELERQKVKMTEVKHREKKKGSLENLINRYEQRNFELEEREVEAKQRLSMIEAAMPAIIAWNMFQIVQNPDLVNVLPGLNTPDFKDQKTREQDVAMFQRLEELLDDHKKLRKDYEKVEESAADRENALKIKIEELEAKAAKDREVLEEMTNSLKTLKMEKKLESEIASPYRTDDVDIFEELKQMVANEIQLRAEIERLKASERAYMNCLDEADEIWAGVEANYEKRLKEADMESQELQKRVLHLEAKQKELEKALEERSGEEIDISAAKNEVRTKIEELIQENEKLKTEVTKSLDRKFDEHKKFLENENCSLKEELKKLKFDIVKEEKRHLLLQRELELARGEIIREKETANRLRREVEEKKKNVSTLELNLQNQIFDLNQELSQKGKELSNLEVTVAELREEVETLENKVAELVETIQTMISNQEEGTSAANTVPKTTIAAQPSPLADRGVRKLVSLNVEPPSGLQKAETSREVIIKEEGDIPFIEFLSPSKYEVKYLILAVAKLFSRQELKLLFPRPAPVCHVQLKFLRMPYTELCWNQNNKNSSKDDEIFQLCIKNTELQQALERMEEEAKLKEKELEDLQKIAIEIRNEQLSLELLYEDPNQKVKPSLSSTGINGDESTADVVEGVAQCDLDGDDDAAPVAEPKNAQSIDNLQITNPIVVKTSDHDPCPLSNLRIAFDNLRNECRAKNLVIKSLIEELRQRGDTLNYEELIGRLSLLHPEIDEKKLFDSDLGDVIRGIVDDNNNSNEKAVAIYKNPRPLTPNNLGRSTSAYYSMLSSFGVPKNFDRKTTLDVDVDFSYVAPIRTVRKVGDAEIFLEWDVSNKPENVMGYEILINGTPSHRVRSSSRNKALLHSLNLKEKVFIQLYAFSERGRSIKCSHLTYTDGHAVYKTESQ